MYRLKIKTLRGGWHDRDQIMLHACFQILVDFVEKELVQEYFALKYYRQRHFSIKSYLWYLWIRNFAKVSKKDVQDMFSSRKRSHQKEIKQCDSKEVDYWKERIFLDERIKYLYFWWKYVRPTIDSHAESGLDKFHLDHPGKMTSYDKKTQTKYLKLIDKLCDVEQKRDLEEDNNLKELISIYRSLWI